MDVQTATRAQLIAALQSVQRTAAALTQKMNDISRELAWQQAILSNPNLQGNTKMYLIALHRALAAARRKGAPEIDGQLRIYRADLAKFAGISDQTVSSQGKKAASNGFTHYTCKTFQSEETGEYEKQTFLAMDPAVYEHPADLAVSTPRQGGKRIPTCGSCGSTNISRRVSYICHDCGTSQGREEVILMSEESLEYEQRLLEENAAEETNFTSVGSVDKLQTALISADVALQAADVKLTFTPEQPLTPSIPIPPERNCAICTYLYSQPIRCWLWSRDEERWYCANEHRHSLTREDIQRLGYPQIRIEVEREE